MKTVKKAFVEAITGDKAGVVMDLLDREKAKVIPAIILTTPFYDGMNMLHISAAKGALETARCLIGRGIDVNLRAQGNISALHIASARGNLSMMGLLLENGAEIATKNDQGNTALHLATMQGNAPPVEFLIKAGAGLHVRNFKGERAEDIAKARPDLCPLYAILLEKRETQERDRFNKRLDYIDGITRRKR